MSNFTFIKIDFPDLFTDAVQAEQLIYLSSKTSAVLMRSVLTELAIVNLVAPLFFEECIYLPASTVLNLDVFSINYPV